MKKALIFLLIIPCFALTHNDIKKKFVGKWLETNGETEFYYLFKEGGYAFLIDGDEEIMGGKEFDLEGERISLSYEIVNNVSPYHLDLVFKSLDKNKEKRMRFLAEFTDNNTLKLATDPDNFDIRPKKFTSDNTQIFKRVK